MNVKDRSIGTGLFIALGGAVFTLVGFGFVLWDLRSISWPSAKAQLLEARLGNRMGGEGGNSYFPIVRYSYEVGATSYEGSRYCLLDWGTSSKTMIERLLERLRERQRTEGHIAVHYDPAQLGQSVVENRPQLLPLICAAFGSIFAFAGIAHATAAVRRRIVFNGLAVGSGAFCAVGIVYFIFIASDSAASVGIALAWPLLLLLAVLIATRHRDYVHAPAMEGLASGPSRGAAGGSTMAARKTFRWPAPPRRSSAGQGARGVPPTPTTISPWTPAVAGAVVFLLFAGFGLLTGGGAGKFFGFPFPLIVVGFGAVAGIATAALLSWARRMMAQAHEAAWAAYEDFARTVGGQRRGTTPPRSGPGGGAQGGDRILLRGAARSTRPP